MKQRDLFTLPLGSYKLKDPCNFTYTLEISKSDNFERFYRITYNSTRAEICMYESWVNEYGNSYSCEGELKYKTFSAIAGAGYLSVHSFDNRTMIGYLSFIPRGSFKKFVEITKM